MPKSLTSIKAFSAENAQTGQVFVIVVLLMTASLIVGTTISTRFLSSLRGYTRVDDQSKARATAESLLERLLVVPFNTLQDFITYNSCGANCTLTLTDYNSQLLTATATLSFSGNSGDAYEVTAPVLSPAQINLSGYSAGKKVTICWNNEASVLARYLYEEGNEIKSTVYAYYANTTTFGTNNFSQALPRLIYQNCFDLTATGTPLALRLKSYYLDTKYFVLPDNGATLPIQGINIVVTGNSNDSTRTISALRTFSYAPELFDFALYQFSDTEALSNKIY